MIDVHNISRIKFHIIWWTFNRISIFIMNNLQIDVYHIYLSNKSKPEILNVNHTWSFGCENDLLAYSNAKKSNGKILNEWHENNVKVYYYSILSTLSIDLSHRIEWTHKWWLQNFARKIISN